MIASNVALSGCRPTIALYSESGDAALTSVSEIEPATSLAWIENSPTKNTGLTASWTPTLSMDVRKQTIEFFSDDRCLNSTGPEIELLSGVTGTKSFTGTNGETYTFHVTTFNQVDASTVSECSPAISVDTAAPTVTMNRKSIQPALVNTLPIQFAVEFNEAITASTFTASDIAQTGTASGITWQISNSGDDRSFTLSATAITTPGTILPEVNAESIQDTAGNTNTLSTSTDPLVTYDNQPVSVTINQAASQPDPVGTLPIDFTVIFSKTIQAESFSALDIGQTGSATGVSWEITNPSTDSRTFLLRATAASGGTLQPTIAAQVVLDAAGNFNLASTTTDNTIMLDLSAPSVIGLSNDTTAAKTKSWSWSCDQAPCTYRSLIDQNTGTVPSGSYNSTTSASQSSGTGTFYLHVQAKDAQGNESAVVTVSAVLDNTAPSAPSALALVTPATSPGTDATPTIRVSGLVAGDSVELYVDSGCSIPGLHAAGEATGPTLDLTSNALSNGSHSFYAKATDSAGNSSTCSIASAAYVLDTAAVNVTGLSGSITPSKTVSWNWGCNKANCTYRHVIDQAASSSPVSAYGATASASQASGTGTYYIHVQAKDDAGNESEVVTVSAVLDNTAPGVPSGLTLITPAASPGNNSTPTIRISGVTSGDTIELHSNSSCTSLTASGTAAGVTLDLQSSALSDGSYSFYSRSTDAAGNTSSCSTAAVDYELDTAAVSVTGLSNDSTSAKNKSWNWGCNKASCTYRYVVDQIAGTSPGTAYDATTSASQISGTGTYYIHVQAKDNAGNTSAVTTVSAIIDNTAPAVPSGLSLITPAASPGNNTAPTIRISGITNGDTIELHSNSSCTSLKASGVAAGTTRDLQSSALTDGSYAFYAKAIDTAGNASSCSTATVAYVLDAAPVSVTGLSDDATPAKTKGWSWGCDKASCTYRFVVDQIAGTAPSGAYGATTSTSQLVGTGTYYLHVQAIDTAGNTSAVRTVSAVLDNTAPGIPSALALSDPVSSPGTDSTPSIQISGVSSGDTITLHTDATCTGPNQKASAIASGSTITLTSSALPAASYTFYAKATDSSGNPSICSTATVAYQYNAPAAGTVLDVSAGYSVCAIQSDHSLWCWGQNTVGELGLGNYYQWESPMKVGSATDWEAVSAGGSHACAMKSNGTLWCWGSNYYGGLGDGTTTHRTSPVQIGTATNWAQMSLGDAHSCGLQTDGTLWCWGRNDFNQVGDGTTTQRTSPVPVGTGANWSQLTAGDGHSCAIQNDNTLWCWGRNHAGQLGDGTLVNRSTPTRVGTDSDWAQVSVGASHTCATKSGGSLWCWGLNNFGQLGDGTLINKSSPIRVGTGTNWKNAWQGGNHICATKTDNTLWCWGDNATGKLGDGTTTGKTSPVQIAPGTTWLKGLGRGMFSCGIKSDNTLSCWGGNSQGTLGMNDTIARYTPTSVVWNAVDTSVITNSTDPINYSFACNKESCSFECKLEIDGTLIHDFQACTSPLNYPSYSVGCSIVLFWVRATSGTTDPTPAYVNNFGSCD